VVLQAVKLNPIGGAAAAAAGWQNEPQTPVPSVTAAVADPLVMSPAAHCCCCGGSSG